MLMKVEINRLTHPLFFPHCPVSLETGPDISHPLHTAEYCQRVNALSPLPNVRSAIHTADKSALKRTEAESQPDPSVPGASPVVPRLSPQCHPSPVVASSRVFLHASPPNPKPIQQFSRAQSVRLHYMAISSSRPCCLSSHQRRVIIIQIEEKRERKKKRGGGHHSRRVETLKEKLLP